MGERGRAGRPARAKGRKGDIGGRAAIGTVCAGAACGADGAAWSKNEKPHQGLPWWGQSPATTYFPAEQYHRPQGLDCCVRDGNRYDPLRVVTDKAQVGWWADRRGLSGWLDGRLREVAAVRRPSPGVSRDELENRYGDMWSPTRGRRSGARLAAEPLTVSTAPLRASLPVHARPINLVVYQGSHVLRLANLVLRGASRLDAFSGYPCRT